ncbi:MAG TPA: hypothetical protein VL588_03190, partial [Bdellovibrionota bacterium]|nr:hypothetical protein [Bdellovibrionota bacterium]
MDSARTTLIAELLTHADPSVRWAVRTNVLGEDVGTKSVRTLQEEIRKGVRVEKLLASRDAKGRLMSQRNIYDKWQGAHWVLATLAQIGYPAGDRSLVPMRDQVLDYWLQDSFYQEFEARTKADSYMKDGVPLMQGRYRRCASQQGNALFFLARLGIADERSERLVERLLHWQWPDGGWNCDRDPGADTSSFVETLFPMRGLSLYGAENKDRKARQAALRASEVLLTRRLFRRRSDGKIIHREFTVLHYPRYWHYDILGGLVAMADVGLIKDPRCADALDLLESKELPQGGWPAEARYYKVTNDLKLGADYVDWGGTGKKK